MKRTAFDEELYKRASINDLILFCIYFIGDKCSFEELIKECFSFFPKAFSFPQHSKWPDARKLDRSLRTLRDKKLITGGPQDYFSLTKSGKIMAEDISKTFRQRKLFK